MRKQLVAILPPLLRALLLVAAFGLPAHAEDNVRILEEIWALPLPLPMFAYVVRPVGDGPFPLAIMNDGVSLKPIDRGFFPLVEFRDAAKWFAKRGYFVVAPVGTGYGAAAIDMPERWSMSGSSTTWSPRKRVLPTSSSDSPPAAGLPSRCRA